MTSPFGQEVVKVPGVGEELQNAIAPFVQAMQFRQRLEQERAAEEQRVAAELFARGLQTTPGFESTPAAATLASKLGVPGLGESIAKARTAEERRRIEDINTFVESLSGLNDQTKSGLRVSLVAGSNGATADVQNSLFSAMAAGQDLSALEQARLDYMKTQTMHMQLEIDKMKQSPGPHDQLRAAQLLGVNTGDMQQGGSNPGDFVTGMNYITVLEDRLKAKDVDPGKALLTTATSIMTTVRNMVGTPKLLPEEAFNEALGLVKSAFPKTAANMKLDPPTRQTLQATHDAMIIWQGVRTDGNVLKDATGRVTQKFKTQGEVRAYITAEMEHLFPLVDKPRMKNLMDMVENRILYPIP